jgi:hypothetical protein
MIRPSSIARAIVVLALAGGFAACTKTLVMSSIQKIITDGVSTQMGLKVTSVTCPPESRPLKAGDTFDCTATPEGGGTLTIKITQKDDAGNISWELSNIEGMLSLTKLEETIKSGLMEQAKINATVSCGGKWHVSKKDDVFNCEATDPAGKAMTIIVTGVTTSEALRISEGLGGRRATRD